MFPTIISETIEGLNIPSMDVRVFVETVYDSIDPVKDLCEEGAILLNISGVKYAVCKTRFEDGTVVLRALSKEEHYMKTVA